MLRALRPLCFWNAVRVEDRPEPRRLAIFLILLVVAAHVLIAIPSGLVVAKQVWGPFIPALAVTPVSRPFPGPRPSSLSPSTEWQRLGHAFAVGGHVALNPFSTYVRNGWLVNPSPIGPSFLSGVIALFVLPFTIGAARGIFREGRAKSAHFWRVWVYGWTGPVILVVLSKFVLLIVLGTGLSNPGFLLPHHDDAGFWVTPDATIWLGPAMFAWAARWWYVAAAKYLKWERPLAVSLAACTAAFCLVFGIMLLWCGRDYVLAI